MEQLLFIVFANQIPAQRIILMAFQRNRDAQIMGPPCSIEKKQNLRPTRRNRNNLTIATYINAASCIYRCVCTADRPSDRALNGKKTAA